MDDTLDRYQATTGVWQASTISISATYISLAPPLPATPAGQGIVAPSATYLALGVRGSTTRPRGRLGVGRCVNRALGTT